MIENIGAYSQVDFDRGYQQGRADAIDEFARLIHEDLYQLNHHQVDFLAEQLKEQTE